MNYEFDSHTHSIASGHAYNTILELVRGAADKGLKMLGITDHAPGLPRTTHRDHFYNLKIIDREIYGVRLLLGVELNIMDFDGAVDLEERLLRQMDVAIASMHRLCMPLDGTVEQYTRAALLCMDNPYVDILGHPDDGDYPVDYEVIVPASLEKHVLLEANNTSLTPTCHRVNSRENLRRMLLACKQYNAPVVIGSDAHFVSLVGAHNYVDELLGEIDFPEKLVMNASAQGFLDFLAENRRKRQE